ncbi:MAG: DUF1385 domain-containing protein [bacterium]|nr:DUF1385 domain-containing protein [Candidatus Sumerlaeota bacterium]
MLDTPLMIGGQAVIEGVMMRGPQGYAISVRKNDGTITTAVTPLQPLTKRIPSLNIPVLRGAASLIEMLTVGIKSLEFSANEFEEDNGSEKDKKAPNAKQSRFALAVTIIISVLIGILLFVVAPNLATHFAGKLTGQSTRPLLEEKAPVVYNLISGAIRVFIIVGYIWVISLMNDVRRLFSYHGAEHKTVSAFEAGQELTVDNVRPHSTLHPRCGTTFIAIVLIISIIIFAFFARALVFVWPGFSDLSFPARKAILITGHILIMPVVAGVCFELLRLGAKYGGNFMMRAFITPGFWFQRLTTREPDDSMLEVAITALKSALAIGHAPEGNQATDG